MADITLLQLIAHTGNAGVGGRRGPGQFVAPLDLERTLDLCERARRANIKVTQREERVAAMARHPSSYNQRVRLLWPHPRVAGKYLTEDFSLPDGEGGRELPVSGDLRRVYGDHGAMSDLQSRADLEIVW